ncbi:MAG TPA: histidine kinase [Noviherbaspirillum sp.]
MHPPLRILHVEDSADDAELLRVALQSAGNRLDYRRVDTLPDLKSALAAERWDVIVSDFNLPTFTAYDVLNVLRDGAHDIPLIVASGFIGEQDAVALMKAGVHDYVMKDKLARLAPAIEREIKEAGGRAQRRQADQAVAASQKLLQNITSALGEGLLVVGKDCRLILMNTEAERLLGWRQEELAGKPIYGFIQCLRADGARMRCQECSILNYPATASALRTEDQYFVRRDGIRFPVTTVTTPIIENGMVVATVTVFQDITDRKRAEQELRESRRQLQELSAFLQQVREDERTRIARELHDELGQALTALRIDLNWLDAKLPEKDRIVADKLSAMLGLVDKTVDAVRRISEDLRPGMLDDLGLAAAIEHHAAKFADQTGIACTLSMNRDDFDLEDRVATTLFRVLQESLTNVARHAQATTVTVLLESRANEIVLAVQDDGCGLPAPSTPRKKTYGLLGMQERVKLLGGTLDISGPPRGGTRIAVAIPLTERQST